VRSFADRAFRDGFSKSKKNRLTDIHLDYAKKIIGESQDHLTMGNIRDRLVQKFPNLCISDESLRLKLKKLCSFKKVRREFIERNNFKNKQKRKELLRRIIPYEENDYEIIYLDETMFKFSDTVHEKQWALKGKEKFVYVPHEPEVQLSMFGAISSKRGLIGVRFTLGWYKDTDFLSFLVSLKTELGISKNDKVIFFLDNVNQHKSRISQFVLRSTGIKIMFNAPYSPPLNPIEQMFGILKGKLKQNRPRTIEGIKDATLRILCGIKKEDIDKCVKWSRGQYKRVILCEDI